MSETYVLNELQPNTLYYIWLAAKSKRGEGATTSPIAVRTDQYGESQRRRSCFSTLPHHTRARATSTAADPVLETDTRLLLN